MLFEILFSVKGEDLDFFASNTLLFASFGHERKYKTVVVLCLMVAFGAILQITCFQKHYLCFQIVFQISGLWLTISDLQLSNILRGV